MKVYRDPLLKCNNPRGHYYWDPRKKCLSEFLGHHCNCTGICVSFRILSRPNAPWALWLMGGGKRWALSNADKGRSWYMWYRNPSRNSHKTCLYLNSPKIFTKKISLWKSKVAKVPPGPSFFWVENRGWAIRFDGAGRPPSVGRQQNWSAMVYPCAYDNG